MKLICCSWRTGVGRERRKAQRGGGAEGVEPWELCERTSGRSGRNRPRFPPHPPTLGRRERCLAAELTPHSAQSFQRSLAWSLAKAAEISLPPPSPALLRQEVSPSASKAIFLPSDQLVGPVQAGQQVKAKPLSPFAKKRGVVDEVRSRPEARASRQESRS